MNFAMPEMTVFRGSSGYPRRSPQQFGYALFQIVTGLPEFPYPAG
jgi:hypothetical protein